MFRWIKIVTYIVFITGYVSAFALQSEPILPTGNPKPVKFWDAKHINTDNDTSDFFKGKESRRHYFARSIIDVNDPFDHDEENHIVSPAKSIDENSIGLFDKIILLKHLDKSKTERYKINKLNRFLKRNYKTQILPEEVYDNAHLPRPFYLYELKNWVFSAVARNDINFVRTLLDNYSLMDAKNDDGYGLLSYAALNNKADMVRFLIRRGANISETSKYKETPLSIASRRDNFEIVKILANSGCEIKYKDAFGNTALDYALINRNKELYQYLSDLLSKK